MVAVRCAVDPVPDEPAAVVDTKHIPLRAALCGVSDLARKGLAAALMKKIPGLWVIEVSALVDKAFAHLERAHILGQSFAFAHANVHWWMLKVAWKR